MKIEDLPGYTRGAVLSVDGKYRYFLERRWLGAPTKFILGFIMFNPSTADAFDDDPTIRRCINFARGFGFAGIDVCNMFAYRSPHPYDLPQDYDEAAGPFRDHYLKRLSRVNGNRVVVAWGSMHAEVFNADIAQSTLRLVKRPRPGNGHVICCFGLNKMGSPKHPLYLSKRAQLEPFYDAFNASF